MVAASLLTGGIFSAPVVHAEAHVDNPFVGATAYVNPDYTKEVNSSIAKVSNAALKAKMAIVKSYPTSVWLDSIGAIGGGKNAGRLGLIAHLDAALAQKDESAHYSQLCYLRYTWARLSRTSLKW